jgi:hypothetical protein
VHRPVRRGRSNLKDVTLDAVDISDLAATREVAAQVESEHRIVEIQRIRLYLKEEGTERPLTASGAV